MCPVLIACDTVQIEARSSLMQAVISSGDFTSTGFASFGRTNTGL